MSATTAIEWTDKTWNPVTGCTKVSPGCAHCYAEGIAKRLWPTTYPPMLSADGQTRPRLFKDVLTHEDQLPEPLSWRKPARVFVNSMSDLFHEDVPDAFIDQVFAVMAVATRHTFQVLTKRPARMRAYFADERSRKVAVAAQAFDMTKAGPAVASKLVEYQNYDAWPLPNVWLGVSVENQHFADERIPLLLQTPAAVRFISAEPLLGLTDMFAFLATAKRDECLRILRHGGPTSPGLDWVIVGGESGPGARPFDLAWARSIVEQCQAAGVPVFVKQLGAKPGRRFQWRVDLPDGTGHGDEGMIPLYLEGMIPLYLNDRKGGDPAEWPQDLRVREFPV